MSDDKSKPGPKTTVTQKLTFDRDPPGIDIAAIMKKRFERSLEEDKRRAQDRRSGRRTRDKA